MTNSEKTPPLSVSESIADFLGFLKDAVKQYDVMYNEVGQADKEKCDLEHALELNELSYHEFAKISKQIRDVLKKRREAKDAVQVLTPIKEFYNMNSSTIKAMERLLGVVRKEEKHLTNRIYVPRTDILQQNK